MFELLYIRSVIKTEDFILTRKFKCIHPETKDIIVVPAGFKTNFATIPRALWWFIASDDKDIREASVVHDWLYSKDNNDPYSREYADNILRIGMRHLGAPVYKQLLVFYLVRIFGKHFYKKS